MSISRRNFLGWTLQGGWMIALGKPLRVLSGPELRIPSSGESVFRFAVVSDGHYGQPGTPYERLHDEMIEQLILEKAERGLRFTMVNGDLFHNDPVFLPEVKKRWERMNMPFHISHGNHDQVTEAVWKNTFNREWHYTFELKDAAFLVLNTANEKGIYVCPDMDWTRRQLIRYQTKKHLFVFMHITPFSWTRAGHPCPDLVELFSRQKNLVAVFHGHDHDQDAAREHEGKYYIFDSHVGGDWGTAYHGYRIVEILTSGDVLTYQLNPANRQTINSTPLDGTPTK